MMTIQVLVTTMKAVDFSKIEKMNIRDVDVLIANQTDHCGCQQKNFPERSVHACMVSTNTTGAGLNRNIAIAHADADILVFADDDMEFSDDFAKIISRDFEEHPQIQAIKYYCENKTGAPLAFRRPSSFRRGGVRTLMSAGVLGMAVRRTCIERYDLAFPCSIGPGRRYNCGEDSVFIHNLIKTGAEIAISPWQIACVDQSASTWFTGYHEHYFETKGYVYYKIYGKFSFLMMMRFAFKMRGRAGIPMGKILRMMYHGAQVYRSL